MGPRNSNALGPQMTGTTNGSAIEGPFYAILRFPASNIPEISAYGHMQQKNGQMGYP